MKDLLAQRKKEYDKVFAERDQNEFIDFGNLGKITPSSSPANRAVQIAYVRYHLAERQWREQNAREKVNALIAEQVELERVLRGLFN